MKVKGRGSIMTLVTLEQENERSQLLGLLCLTTLPSIMLRGSQEALPHQTPSTRKRREGKRNKNGGGGKLFFSLQLACLILPKPQS